MLHTWISPCFPFPLSLTPVFIWLILFLNLMFSLWCSLISDGLILGLLISCAGCKLEGLLPDPSINDWMRGSWSVSAELLPRSGLLSHTRISESTEKALCLSAPVSRAIAMATWWLWSIMRWLEGDGCLLSERRPVLSHFGPGVTPSLKLPSLKAFVMWPATLSLLLKFSAVSSDQ